MAEPEIIDISNLGSNELGMTNDSELKSTNFGPGIELLMNEKKNKPINFEKNEGDIMDLEEELNNLTDNIDNVEYNIPSTKSQSVEFNLSTSQLEPINLGEDLSKNLSDEKTWDGYGKFNDIPMDPDKRVSTQSQLSKEEMLREKFNYLRKLEQLEKRGVELTKKYTIDSNLMEMIGEYEMVMSEKEKQNSVKFQGNMLSALS